MVLTPAFGAIFSIAGCVGDSSELHERLEGAEARWRENGYSSYRIEVRIRNATDRTVELVVREGDIEEAELREEDDDESTAFALSRAQAEPYTVKGLFQTVREEVASGQRTLRAWFHPELGYVERLELTPRTMGSARQIVVRRLTREERGRRP